MTREIKELEDAIVAKDVIQALDDETGFYDEIEYEPSVTVSGKVLWDLRSLAQEVDELQGVLDLRRKASQRAVKKWRDVDPEKRSLTLPNHADLCVWLLEQLEEARAHLTALKAGDNGEALEHADRQICYHEETHRGGAIWTICDQCGAKFADDEGGVPVIESPYEQALSEMRERLK